MEQAIEIPTPRKSGRGYVKHIPIENIIELKRKDLTDEQVAALLGCERSNITKRLAKHKDEIEGLDRFKKHRGDILAWNQKRLLGSITDDEIRKAPLGTKVLAACQLYDKERLERGLSTNNQEIHHVTLERMYAKRLSDSDTEEDTLSK